MRVLLPVLLAATLSGCGGATERKAEGDTERVAPIADSATPSDSGAGDLPTPPPAPCTGRGTAVSALSSSGCTAEAACAWSGDLAYEYFGYALAGGGDFDGDGVEDVVVGALFSDTVSDGATVYDVGKAVIWSGAEIAAGGAVQARAVAGLNENEQAGSSVFLLGDLDGDNDSELLIGARNHGTVGSPSMGAVHLVLGGPDLQPVIHRTWTGTEMYGRAGQTVASPGDMDGDGLPEVAIAGDLWRAEGTELTEVLGSGRIFLASGGALPDSGLLTNFPVQFSGGGSTDQAGMAIDGGDLDEDGYADLVVGAPYGATSRGAVYIILGGPEATQPISETLDEVAMTTLEGTGVGDAFGWSISVGEITGDASLDLAVGAPLHDAPWGAEGEVQVFAGGAWSSTPTPTARRTGEHDDHQLGTGLEAGRDLDGDGIGDLVVGAVAAWHGLRPKSGRSYVLPGGTTLTGDATITGAQQIHAAGTRDYLGRATATSDVDRDGISDLIVATAYANVEGRTDTGAVWLFFGG